MFQSQVWHLVRHDSDSQKDSERSNKLVSEIYLTRYFSPHQVLFTFRGYLTWCFSLLSPHITSSNYSYYSNSGVSGCALNGEAVASDPAARLTERQCLSCQFCPTCCHV